MFLDSSTAPTWQEYRRTSEPLQTSSECKHLLLTFWNELAKLFNQAEQTSLWPMKSSDIVPITMCVRKLKASGNAKSDQPHRTVALGVRIHGRAQKMSHFGQEDEHTNLCGFSELCGQCCSNWIQHSGKDEITDPRCAPQDLKEFHQIKSCV